MRLRAGAFFLLALSTAAACGTLTEAGTPDAGDAGDATVDSADDAADDARERADAPADALSGFCATHAEHFICLDFDDDAGAANAFGPIDGATAVVARDQFRSPPASLRSVTAEASAPRGNTMVFVVPMTAGAAGQPAVIDLELAVMIERAPADGFAQITAVRLANTTQYELDVQPSGAFVRASEDVHDASTRFTDYAFEAGAAMTLHDGTWHDVTLHVDLVHGTLHAAIDGAPLDGAFQAPPSVAGVALFLGATYDSSTSGVRMHIDDVLFDPK